MQLFPTEISDIILSYLSKSDILQASLVSKQWYNIIGQSKKCMSKVVLYYKGQLDQDINTVLNSHRRYQNILFMCSQDEFIKKRRIENVFRLILNKFSDSITCLQTSHDTKRVSLPKLKKVSIRLNSRYRAVIHPNGILSTSQIIERLDLRCILDDKSNEIMKNFLQSMKNLKSLTGFLYYVLYNWRSWFDRQFCLKDVCYQPFRGFINEFLLQHTSTIEKVRLSSAENLTFFLTSFPHLHTLCFEQFNTTLTMDYPLNETVTTLTISNTISGSLNYSIIRLLSKLKNLKNLKILSLSFEVFIAIYSIRASLKTFMFRELVENTELLRLGLKLLSLHVKIYQVIFCPQMTARPAFL